MPKAKKSEVRELSLTSSFVAGGYSYHADPTNLLQLGAGGKPLVFLRFEDSDNRRSGLTSDDFYNSNVTPEKIIPVLSSTLGPDTASNLPIYTANTPYRFTNTVIGDRLTTDSSSQVRSLELGSNAGVFTSNLGTFVKVDNVSPTTSMLSNVEGNDHLSLGVQDSTFTLSLLSPFKGFTVSAWINTRKTELIANFTGGGPQQTTKHYRPIFRSTRSNGSDGNEEALISFGHIVSLINPATQNYYHSDLHKRLYFRYKDSYGATPSVWVSKDLAQIVDGEWAHVAAVVAEDNSSDVTSGTVIRFYCNGRLLGTVPYSIQPAQSKNITETAIDYAVGGVEDSGHAVTISNLLGNVKRVVGSFFVGNIDDVALWNRGLSGDELAAIYHSHRGAYPPGSGYLNNPPRTIIAEQDNKAGSYPAQISPGDAVLNAPLYSDELTVETPKVNAELDLNFIDIPEHLSKIVFSEGAGSPAVTANWQSVAVGYEVDIGNQLYGSDDISSQECVYNINGFDASQPEQRGSEFFVTSTGRMTYIKVQAPCDGVMNLSYAWTSSENSNELTYDWPFYDVTSYEPVSTDISDAGTSAPDPVSGNSGGSFAYSTPGTGTVTITYSQGDWISIGIYSIDSVGGAGVLQLSNENVLCGLTCPEICGEEIAFKFYRSNPVPSEVPTVTAATGGDLVEWSEVKQGSVPNLGSDSITQGQGCIWSIAGFEFTVPGNPIARVTYIKIKAPCDGTMCFDWLWSTNGPTLSNDYGFWAIFDTEPTSTGILPTPVIFTVLASTPSSLAGTACISYKKDQWIAIGVTSNCAPNTGTLTVSNPVVNPNYAVTDPMCGLQCQGCGSTIIPVNITDVAEPQAVKNPKLLAEDIALGGSYLEVNTSQKNLDLSIKSVVDRLVRVGSLEAVRNLLGIEFKTISGGKGVRIKQLQPGAQGNIPVYAKSLAKNNEPMDSFGYKLLPYPHGVGLQSALRNQVFNFTGGQTSTARFPFGAPIDDNDPTSARNSLFRRALASPNAGSVSVVGSGYSNLIGGTSDQHPSCEFTPYNETNAVQAFGIPEGSPLYGTQGEIYDEFFTRGSTQGSLDESLRNKDRIVIDLTPSAETSLKHSDGVVDPNYPMAYFNFESKKWEPIGFGDGVGGALTTIQEVLDSQYLGFSQGWGNLYDLSSTSNVSVTDTQLRDNFTNSKHIFRETGWFSPIDTFGFPLHPKYHATGSQQLDAEYLVDRPFIIEKIVYEFSASMPNIESKFNPLTVDKGEYHGAGGAFFILNQRKANPDPGQESSYTKVYVSKTLSPNTQYATPQDGGTDGALGDYFTVSYDNGGIPQTKQLSTGGPSVYVDTVRDLVTFARFGTVWPSYDEEISNLIEPEFPHPALFMDLAIEVPASGTFSGDYTLAAPVRAPAQNSAIANIDINGTIASYSPNNINSLYASKDSSTRNSLDIATGRAHRAEFFGPEISYRVNGYDLSKQIFAPKTDSAPSPYLIRPGDKLVFGWQSPTFWTLYDTSAAKVLKLLPGKGKLILYGSYLRDDKPVHNIFKECLTSDAAHETIPSGPWVLDRFESEPQMMYSGSMREEHVTGTMLTRNADGTFAITDPSDFSIGGVRAVSARVSNGDVKQRWSFFRNSRAYNLDEQYYDSMQPNPIKLLFDYKDTTAAALATNAKPERGYAYILPPSGVTDVISVFANASVFGNRVFVGSFPFEEKYSEIQRAKRINTKLIDSTPVRTYIFDNSLNPDPTTHTYAGLQKLAFLGFQDTTDNQFSADGALAKSYGYTTLGLLGYPVLDSNDTELVPGSQNEGFLFTGSCRDVSHTLWGTYNPAFSKFFGCFGSGYYQLPMFRQATPIALPPLAILKGMIYRGVKHGLINPTPFFSNAVFSSTGYGQFRDMLEQRQYTRFNLSDSSLTDAAVDVSFIDRSIATGTTNYITSGSATNSSNISQFATSAHPYDDTLASYGLIWDRNTPLPETLAI